MTPNPFLALSLVVELHCVAEQHWYLHLLMINLIPCGFPWGLIPDDLNAFHFSGCLHNASYSNSFWWIGGMEEVEYDDDNYDNNEEEECNDEGGNEEEKHYEDRIEEPWKDPS